MMTYGSVCSGIEAVSVAWRDLGLRPAWFSEIEPFPCAVLTHHYQNVKNYGDMTKLPERILSGEIDAPDILVGGTPCQSFSVAGLRKSLDDERGNLTLVFVRILNAINTVRRRNGKPDAVALWENVPGVLSTRDNAFGCFLGALLSESKELIPPRGGWTGAGIVRSDKQEIAWRILDAKYFGVPQRRRRVFLAAGPRNRRIAEILFEQSSERGNFKKGEEKKEGVTAFIESGFGKYRESNKGGTVMRSGGTLSGGSETLLVSKSGIAGAAGSDDCSIGLTVRKLTPKECERLQGFPDDYTRVPWRGRPAGRCPDTPRYKAIGNSMAVPVMRWIGNRILEYTKND